MASARGFRQPDRAVAAHVEGALPADVDRALCGLDARRRPSVRPVAARARAARRGDPAPGARVAADHGHGRRVGGVDGDGVPGERRLRLPARSRAARGRPRGGRRLVLGAERLEESATGSAERVRVLSIIHQPDAGPAACSATRSVPASASELDEWDVARARPEPPQTPIELYGAVLDVRRRDARRPGWASTAWLTGTRRSLLRAPARGRRADLLGVCLGGAARGRGGAADAGCAGAERPRSAGSMWS